jgi:hypothetical protein
MASIAPADILILSLRLAFVILLYTVVLSVLMTLYGGLRRSAAAAPRDEAAASRLTLVEALPADGPLGRTIVLTDSQVMGRREECEVVLHDDSVSGRHARLSRTRGGWLVEDLGSTNGTYLNGRRIASPAALQAGDVITVGASSWRYEDG